MQPEFKKISHNWKVNIGGLFNEMIDNNHNNWIFIQPIKLIYGILQQTAKRAVELEDDKLIGFMCRLGMYEFSDPTHPDYNAEAAQKYIDATATQ